MSLFQRLVKVLGDNRGEVSVETDGDVLAAAGGFVGGGHLQDAGAELALGEGRIDQRDRDAVEGEIPRGIPRIFPFVRHGNNI